MEISEYLAAKAAAEVAIRKAVIAIVRDFQDLTGVGAQVVNIEIEEYRPIGGKPEFVIGRCRIYTDIERG